MRKKATTTLPVNLVQLASGLTGLQARRRREMKQVRVTTAEIRAVKRDLRALAQSMAKPDPFDQVPPMRFEGVDRE